MKAGRYNNRVAAGVLAVLVVVFLVLSFTVEDGGKLFLVLASQSVSSSESAMSG